MGAAISAIFSICSSSVTLIKVTAIFYSAFFVVSEEREAGHLVGEGADERKCLHIVNIPGEIEVEVILEIALRDGAGFDFCEVQAEQSETLQRMAQRARSVRQREAQADLFRVFGQNGFTRNDDEARAVVIGILDIGGDDFEAVFLRRLRGADCADALGTGFRR